MAGMAPHGDQSFASPYRLASQERHEERGLGASWYYSRKEIEENSPSRKDGIDLKKEAYLRKSYCTFLQDLGMRLKVPQVTIATAIMFCHRFFLRQSHAKNDRRTIATVCMFLAGKVEETPRPLKDVIMVSYEILNKKDADAVQRIKQREVYEQQKELILIGERVVLATLSFDLNVNHPYKPLVDAIKKFQVSTQNALAQVAWNFVNDGLRTSLGLQFKPHHIAAGAIFLAAKFLKVKLPSDGDKVWWQQFDVTPRQLEEVSNQMLELYEQNRVAQTATPTNNEEAMTNSSSPLNDPPSSSSHHNISEPVRDQKPEAQLPGLTPEPVKEKEKSLLPPPNISGLKSKLEKRRKSNKVERERKVDVLDEDDLIERELEHGVEQAIIGNKKGGSANSLVEDFKEEEGEVSVGNSGGGSLEFKELQDGEIKKRGYEGNDLTRVNKRFKYESVV
ncbi:hypothetical protein LUZ60_010394 [Juncus effusus]|nr:hypothetical protein LUZ60_010394 [Juncus effusus]